MHDPAQNLFCWRCHGYQQTTMEGATLNLRLPERCLDADACLKEWTDAVDRQAAKSSPAK